MYWYLATPYSKYPLGQEQAFADACRQAAMFIKAKVPIFCPIAHTHPIAIHGGLDELDLDIWMPADKALMDAACGIIVCMLPTWRISRGITYEVGHFKEMGKPVFHIEPFKQTEVDRIAYIHQFSLRIR